MTSPLEPKDRALKVQGFDQQSGIIDVKRIAYRAIRYWYIIVVLLVASLAVAFYNNRYTQRIYPVTASIIIREKEETSGAEILYKNAIVDQYRNYLNEPYIIRSYQLIQRVVQDLNLNVTFYKEGYVLTTEVYNALPFKVTLKRPDQPTAGKYIFRAFNDRRYYLELPGRGSASRKEFEFGQLAVFADNEFQIDLLMEEFIPELMKDAYILEIEHPFSIAAQYAGRLNVNWAEEGSGVINLSINGPNPLKEVDFINSLIKNYQAYDLEKKNQAAIRTVDFIKGQLVKISDSLRLFEGQLQQFKKNNRTTGDMSLEARRVFDKLENLEVKKTELSVRSNYFEYLKKSLDDSRDLDRMILPTQLGINDPVLTQIISKIVDLQVEVKLYYGKEKNLNPLLTNKLGRLNELKREVNEAIESLRSIDKINLDFLNKQILDVERHMGYLPLAERQLISIQRNYSLLENLYVFLMQKMSEAEISKASNTSDILMVNPPMQSGGAISPNVSQNYTFGVLAGVGLPLLLFVLLEVLDNRVQSREDIEKLTSIPFMGGVGHKKNELNLEVLKSPKSSISESFRAMRSNLSYFVARDTSVVVLITSSISGEGKTFTSINLASVFSLSGKKTLIIGADMRKPKIYMDFGLNNDLGLSSYLSGLATFDKVVQPTGFENLDLISGGPVPPNPSELLLNKRIDAFMDEARGRYDYIVIDTPPMAVVTDVFALSRFVDHAIFLVRQNYTPKILLKSVQDYYSSGKLGNVSVVFNDIYRSGPGYGYGYSYGYGYYTYAYGAGRKHNSGYYNED